MSHGPIGVFDSGIGGLSVLRHLTAQLPNENYLYYADSAYAPYGNKPTEFTIERAQRITDFLLTRGSKAIVVACNTATSAAIQSLRAKYSIPIIGMEPGVKPAVAATNSGIIGILATTNTLNGKKYEHLMNQYQNHARIINQPCPGLVERIERGHFDDTATRSLLESYLNPLLEQDADVIVLGCTHYPFLLPMIQEIVGPGVMIIDTGPAIAKELSRRLVEARLLSVSDVPGRIEYWTSGEPAHVVDAIRKVTGIAVEVKRDQENVVS